MFTEHAQPTALFAKSPPAVAVRAETDAALLQRIAATDTLAMRVFYARHHVRVYRFVLRIVRDPGIAEDTISEVFLDIWRQAGRFEGRSAVSTWLLAIARHKAFAVMRKRSDEELGDDTAAAIEDVGDNPEVALQKQERSEILRRCLDALPAHNRELLDLAYYHEKSVAEVAEIYGIPQNTVKTRMFSARKKLAEIAHRAGLDRGWL